MPRIEHEGEPGPDLLQDYEIGRLRRSVIRRGIALGVAGLVLLACYAEVRYANTTHSINALAIGALISLIVGFVFADGVVWFWIGWMHAAKEIKRGETHIQAGSILLGGLGAILVAVPFGSLLLFGDDLQHGGFPIRSVTGFLVFAWTHLLGAAGGYAARFLAEFRRLW